MIQKRSILSVLFDYFNIVFMLILSAVFLYPVLNTLALSFSDVQTLGYNNVGVIPKGFSLEAYKYLLSDQSVFRYYMNTVFYAVSATVFSLMITSLTAYPLTFADFSAKKAITVYLTITMFVSGGLIPYYLLIRKLHLINTVFIYIFPGISAWGVIIIRTFFSQLPVELKESAIVDGAGHLRILYQIILPLSKPILATNALFGMVGVWNDFFTALIFINDQNKYPIQMFLRRLLVLFDYKDLQKDIMFRDIFRLLNERTVKSAAVIITITPILFIYPFLQKYFAKGIIIGAIKG